MPGMENAHALVIGIANYAAINPLPPTVLKDAQDIYNTLIHPNFGGYFANNVQLLLDRDATGDALRLALSGLATRANQDSVVTIYLSSHGGQVESGPYAGEYILPVDVDYASDAAIAQTAISGAEFTEALRRIPARRVLILFDCCHSGGIGQPKDATAPAIKGGLPDHYYDRLKQGRGRVILASSRSDEYSWVLPGDENSLFTKQLLAGMRGGIASDDGMIRIFDLFEYLQPHVTASQPNQHPIFKAEIEENFPVALYLGGQKGVTPRDSHDQGFRYDVYISYAESNDREADWVWDVLLPYLDSVGLSVATSDDVRDPGVARVASIERGITQCKRTLLVLSPAYLADQWGQFETTITQTMSIEENRARMTALVIRPLDPGQTPARIGPNIIEHIDASEQGRPVADFNRLFGRRGRNLRRLIKTLQSPLAQLQDLGVRPVAEAALDLFISFGVDDETWVREQLLPQLVAERFRIAICADIDYPDPKIHPLPTEQGIGQATRTLLILSPDYLDQDWPEVQQAIAQTPAFQADKQLVLLQIAGIEALPTALQNMRVLNLTEPRRMRRVIGRLIWQLRDPLP